MSKDFTDVAFSAVEFKKELADFKTMLDSKNILSEREIQQFFKSSIHLTAYIGNATGLNMGIAKQVAYEFELMGDFAADVVFGTREKHFCLSNWRTAIQSPCSPRWASRQPRSGGEGSNTDSARSWTGFTALMDSSQRRNTKRTLDTDTLILRGCCSLAETRGWTTMTFVVFAGESTMSSWTPIRSSA